MKNSFIGFCLSAVLGFAWPAAAQTYKVIDLGTLPGGNLSNALGVNDQGEVVGLASNPSGFPIAFRWTKAGGMKALGTLGGASSSAQSINDANQIVGQADINPAGFTDAFLWQKGKMTPLGSLGGQLSRANAINYDPLTKTFTQIAGWSMVSDNSAYHAVIWDHTLNTTTDLGTLGGTNSWGLGNNCNGQVVGQSDTTVGGSADAFLWDPARGMQDLGTLGGDISWANAVNCSGMVVGTSYLFLMTEQHAFLSTANGMLDLGTFGGTVSEAYSINKYGKVVGFARTTGDTDKHAFVWTANQGMKDLNNMIPANSGWDLQSANSISDSGKIAGAGYFNGSGHAFLLIPQ